LPTSWRVSTLTRAGWQRFDMEHTWLIGMMGSGKSTVGARVAELCDREFLDTDIEVESASGMTIPDLFALGEPVFRSVESAVIATVAERRNLVIATGGGAVLREDNVRHMKHSGRIVHLSVDVPTIEQRINVGEAEPRPLLQSSEDVARLHEQRSQLYHDVSDLDVATIGRSPAEIAEEVVSWLGM